MKQAFFLLIVGCMLLVQMSLGVFATSDVIADADNTASAAALGEEHDNSGEREIEDEAGNNIWITLVIVAVILFVHLRRAMDSVAVQPADDVQTSAQPFTLPDKVEDHTSIEQLKEWDPHFEKSKLERLVRGWIFDFEAAWCSLDMAACKIHLTEELYQSYQNQLSRIQDKRLLPRTNDLEVLECEAEQWSRDDSQEHLFFWIILRKKTYIVSAYNINEVVKGNKTTIYQMYYRWHLRRKPGEQEWKLGKVEKLAQQNLA